MDKQGRILLVEDDEDIRELLTLYLSKQGFAVEAASSFRRASEALAERMPDLLLTDILLPDGFGTELARRIREQSNIPIVFISCKREAQDIIDGLELGADDYITKPFEPGVVVARVKAQLRRATTTPVWRDSWLNIDPVGCTVTAGGLPATLFAKEMQLLLWLASRENQVFGVEQLYEQVWGWEKDSNIRTVMVHISNLRKKIEPNPAFPRYIVTIRGFGYKFCWGPE
ncbi:response regulator transcription factor [Cohnella silvisoli]|uniref:Response regulator transcription factor n=1 Tax=Cohnella silvisoli TaxID=2873699 RepID=A0ABV1L0F5_9BACL|nr:response regulator transcription factor [Cohnella silvisoli]MCD9025175.1 response regulator transcription factor [Cohnella silvisoli]